MNTQKRSDEAAVAAFAAQLQDELIRPSDANYDQARAVWNGIIDRRPTLIARCAGVEDVAAAVNFAREQGLVLSVRGGGHNVAGHGTNDGGLVIDLAPMKRIEVDPVARTARAEGGVTWGELDAATQVHGLATPGGVFSGTGIAGLTLGGGYGWLRARYGLSCDNLIGAEVVTASGQVVRAGESENTDLLWGLRGGGGNFGVVTTFEYRLHPVGPAVGTVFVFHDGEGDRSAQAVRGYRDYMAGAPDEVSGVAFLGIVPPMPDLFPAETHGKRYVAFGAVYAGPPEEGQTILAPLRELGTPLADHSGIRPYVEMQKMFDADYPDGLHYYWKSLTLASLIDAAIERIVAHARQQPSIYSTTDLWEIRGAVARGSAASSAYHGRGAAYLLNSEANWEDAAADDANIGWARALVADIEQYSDGSRYLNFAGFQEEGDEMMRKAFGPQYARLAMLKRKYDPHNLFSLNQNIKPAEEGR